MDRIGRVSRCGWAKSWEHHFVLHSCARPEFRILHACMLVVFWLKIAGALVKHCNLQNNATSSISCYAKDRLLTGYEDTQKSSRLVVLISSRGMHARAGRCPPTHTLFPSLDLPLTLPPPTHTHTSTPRTTQTGTHSPHAQQHAPACMHERALEKRERGRNLPEHCPTRCPNSNAVRLRQRQPQQPWHNSSGHQFLIEELDPCPQQGCDDLGSTHDVLVFLPSPDTTSRGEMVQACAG